jgi:hypothetical protein
MNLTEFIENKIIEYESLKESAPEFINPAQSLCVLRGRIEAYEEVLAFIKEESEKHKDFFNMLDDPAHDFTPSEYGQIHETIGKFHDEFKELVRKYVPTYPNAEQSTAFLYMIQDKTSCFSPFVWSDE